MFLNEKVNYKFKPKVEKYNKICEVLEWQKDLPIIENVDKKLIKYITPKWSYIKVKKNFQDMINGEYLITPEMIVKNNLTLTNKDNVTYGDMTKINNNANDLRTNVKEIVNNFVDKKANDLANADIKKQLEELRKKVNSINDIDIKKEQSK